MGTSSSQPETVHIDALRQLADRKLELKYRQGMAGVLAALTPAFGILVEAQRIAQEMGAIASAMLDAAREGKGVKDPSREAGIAAGRALVYFLTLLINSYTEPRIQLSVSHTPKRYAPSLPDPQSNFSNPHAPLDRRTASF